MFKFILPRIRDILFASIFIVVLLYGNRSLNIDGDLGRHITIGNFIIASKTIPTADIFSHTMAGEYLTPHEWFAQVLFYLSHRAAGLEGVILLQAIIIATAFLVLFNDTYKQSGSYIGSAGLSMLAAAASSIHWLPRPHILTILLLAIWTPLIRSTMYNPRRAYWAAPLIMLIWANSHGAFIAGFVVWVCFVAGWLFDYVFTNKKPTPRGLIDFLIVGAVSFFATLINPAGVKLWSTSFAYIQNEYLVSHTQEYLSPDFHNPGFTPFLVLIVLIIFVFSRALRKLPSAYGFLATGWLAMALYSARNIPLFAIITTPILGYYLNDALSSIKLISTLDTRIQRIESQLRGSLWPFVITVAMALLLTIGIAQENQRRIYHFNPEFFPVTAVDWLIENPQKGKMFNYFTWGGYLLYRLWPNQAVFIDGQTDFYGEQLVREYASVISANLTWDDVFRKYQVQWVIIPPDIPLYKELLSAGWETLYKDSAATILRIP